MTTLKQVTCGYTRHCYTFDFKALAIPSLAAATDTVWLIVISCFG
ncbi:hypothetical protein [Pontibacter roseus]|nr:hypothetical protein [Pontibacter roseus]